MAFVAELHKTLTDKTPVYAVVGVTDLVVEKVREAGDRLAAAQAELAPAALPGKAQESYGDLAVRGEKLLGRLRRQKATRDLLGQAGNTVMLSRGAVTTVRRAAQDTQRAALATLSTTRRESGQVLDTAADAARDEATATATVAKASGRRATGSGRRTAASAKRTSTTARKRTANTQRAGKAAATSTRKTAAGAGRATKAAAAKVGD